MLKNNLCFFGVLLVLTPVALAAGDPTRGAALYDQRCGACHSVDNNRVGPAHRGVYGRRAGMAPDYAYSAALRSSNVVWSDVTLDRWLTNPEKLIPGQLMNYSVASAQDRSDLIAFLKSVSPTH
ncbi:MAG: c-type cytochrome [Burkholderiales bacterium]|nr:c-type cytochrome [Burkholderiales bacterium]